MIFTQWLLVQSGTALFTVIKVVVLSKNFTSEIFKVELRGTWSFSKGEISLFLFFIVLGTILLIANLINEINKIDNIFMLITAVNLLIFLLFFLVFWSRNNYISKKRREIE